MMDALKQDDMAGPYIVQGKLKNGVGLICWFSAILLILILEAAR